MERPFARALSGKISPVTTQAQGPQVAAKKAMYKHTKATRAELAAFWSGKAVPIEATKTCETLIPTAPANRRGLRPHDSTRYNPGTVQTTLTTEVIIVVTNGFPIPEFWKNVVP